jgi:MscS family membrane protein
MGTAFDPSSYLPAWAQQRAFGIAVWQFIAAFLLVLLSLIIKKISDVVFEKKIVPFLERTPFAFDNLFASAVSKPLGYLFLLGGMAGALAVLPLPTEPNVRGFVFGVLRVFAAADVIWFLFRVVDVATQYFTGLAQRTESKLDDQLVPLIRKALKVTIGLICIVWIIQLLGYSVSSLIAGLGIGGLAVALALQDTLANFFGSVVIFLDRPFRVGDWIKLDGIEGIVEDIGFRSTRLRTWPATLVSIPNKTVANAAIDNWSKMPKRRVVQTVGVTYKTHPEQMERAVATIREVVENDKGVDSEYIVIRFTDFGEYSLNILLYYFTTAVAFADHLATKERINLTIMRRLREMGLSIAFPTRTLYFGDQVAQGLTERLTAGHGQK